MREGYVGKYAVGLIISLVIAGILYVMGYFYEAYNAIISNIPWIGGFMDLMDTYQLFQIMNKGQFTSWDNVGLLVSFLASVYVTVWMDSNVGCVQGIYKFVLQCLICFLSNCIVRWVWFEGIGLFLETGMMFIENGMNDLWKPIY